MNSTDMIALQIRLEYQLEKDGSLSPNPGSSEQAYYLVYQHSQGWQAFFNRSIPQALREKLLAIGPQAAFEHPNAVISLIDQGYQTCKGGGEVFWSGYFTSQPDPAEFPLARAVDTSWVILDGGEVVCRAISVRQDEHCAEVYVETSPAYRKRGYGRQAVAAWAYAILQRGRVPFYSHKVQNTASAALAQSLGVTWYASVVQFEAG